MYFILILFVILFLTSFINAAVPTEIFVMNSPPYLQENIPDQSWPRNTHLLDAFDLDHYFIDPNGDPLNYSYSNLTNISIMIHPITHQVSFYTLEDFIGQEIVTFYARDQNFNISSNPVVLLVGLDNVSPTWSFPSKSKATIFQNDMINFSTVWEDNVALKNYVFSINQGTGWINYSSTNFSGIQNTSRTQIQISAPSSNQVFWRFYAWDTSDNMNLTDIQSFTVSSAPINENPSPEEGDGDDGDDGDDGETGEEGEAGGKTDGEGVFPILPKRKLKDFRLNVYEFKVSLKQGASKTVVLKLTNIGTEELNISLSDMNLWDFVVFSETYFQLLPGNSKEVTIDFIIPKTAFIGQYYGFIKANAEEVNKSVSVVLDIQGIDLDFDIDLTIPEDYKTIRPGEMVKATINIFNIKDIDEVNASLYYAIKDFKGGIYNFSEENINFTYSSSLNRSLQVPIEVNEGNYIFYARVSDEKNTAIDSEVFEVGKKFTLNAFLRANGLFLILSLISLFLAIFMVKYQRDKRKERLINLYIALIKLKKLIQNDKQEEALQLFLKIRSDYKEPVSQEALKDKETLKKELLKLYSSINPEVFKKMEKEQQTQEVSSQKTIPPSSIKTIPATQKINAPNSSPVQNNKETSKDLKTPLKENISLKKEVIAPKLASPLLVKVSPNPLINTIKKDPPSISIQKPSVNNLEKKEIIKNEK